MIALILAATLYSAGTKDAYIFTFGDKPAMVLINASAPLPRVKAIRKRYGRDFLWVHRDGRDYVIHDRATLAAIDELFAPQRALEPEQHAIEGKESALDRQIDAIEDSDGPRDEATSARLRDLREQQRAVAERERALDERQEALEREEERVMWRMVDDAIRNGLAQRE